MLDAPTISDKEFRQIRELVYSRFGINLTDQKRALVIGRLSKVLRERGFKNFQQYFDYISQDESGQALGVLVDRISTNHTFFYREPDHFVYLENELLPELIERQKRAGTRKLRIWIAGCSSGEESYLIAMLIHKALDGDLARWDVGLLATDISTTALQKAINGVYRKDNIDHLPVSMRNNYLSKLPDGDYQVIEPIRNLITHRRLNLMRTQYPFKGSFQAIFCRNVMIYFDQPTRAALLQRFHHVMDPDGYLFIGHSESLGRNNPHFNYVMPALYRKSGGQ